MKRVSDTQAGKKISAYVILKAGKVVGKVNAHFSQGYNGITVTVNAWDYSGDGMLQHRKVTYGGIEAALHGMVIDGVELNDHSHEDERCKKVLKNYQKKEPGERRAYEEYCKKKYGISFANWSETVKGFTSCFYHGGLQKLSHMGYNVVCAI